MKKQYKVTLIIGLILIVLILLLFGTWKFLHKGETFNEISSPYCAGTDCPRRFAIEGFHPQIKDDLAALGDGLIETQVLWGQVEPNAPVNGVHKYKSLEEGKEGITSFLDWTKETGREISLMIEVYETDWAIERSKDINVFSPRDGTRIPGFVRIKPEHRQDWKDFIKYVLSISPNLQYVQIDNEPENVWVNGEGYLEELTLAYQAVQEYNLEHETNIKVMAAGFHLVNLLIEVPENFQTYALENYPNIDLNYIRSQLNGSMVENVSDQQILYNMQKMHIVLTILKQKNPSFDIFTMHNDHGKTYDTIGAQVKKYESIMNSMDYDRPIWIDDGSVNYFPVYKGNKATQEDIDLMVGLEKKEAWAIEKLTREQSKWMVRKVTGDFAAGIERAKFAYMIEPNSYYDAVWREQDLFTDDFKPKPAYYTAKVMITKLDYFTKAEKMDGYVYKFSFDGKGSVYVAWDENGGRTLDLSKELGTNVKITHIIKEWGQIEPKVETVRPNNITLGEDPIFIEAQ